MIANIGYFLMIILLKIKGIQLDKACILVYFIKKYLLKYLLVKV